MPSVIKKVSVIFIAIFLHGALFAQEQKTPFYDWSAQIQLGIFQPVGYYEDVLQSAWVMTLKTHFNTGWLPHLFWDGEMSYVFSDLKQDASKKFSILPIGSGFSYYYPLTENFYWDTHGSLGFFILSDPEGEKFTNFYGRSGLGLLYAVNYNLQLGLGGDFLYLHDPEKGISAFEVKLGLRYVFGDPVSTRDLEMSDIEIAPVFANNVALDQAALLGAVKLKNRSGNLLQNVRVTVEIPGLTFSDKTDFAEIPLFSKDSVKTVPLRVHWQEKLRYLDSDFKYQGFIIAEYYRADGSRFQGRKSIELKFYGRNAFQWDKLSRLGIFITYQDSPVLEFARNALQVSLSGENLSPSFQNLLKVTQALRYWPLEYVKDPGAAFQQFGTATAAVDYIQYPRETLIRKSGDCDDLTVLLASLLEAIGIKTALVSMPSHVMLLVESEIVSSKLTVEYEERHWIPLETTLISKGLATMWEAGLQKIKTSKKEILSSQSALEQYAPLSFKEPLYIKPLGKSEVYKAEMALELEKIRKMLAESLKDAFSVEELNQQGISLAQTGELLKAKERFLKALIQDKKFKPTYYNLLNVYKLLKDFKAARELYQELEKHFPGDETGRELFSQIEREFGSEEVLKR